MTCVRTRQKEGRVVAAEGRRGEEVFRSMHLSFVDMVLSIMVLTTILIIIITVMSHS